MRIEKDLGDRDGPLLKVELAESSRDDGSFVGSEATR